MSPAGDFVNVFGPMDGAEIPGGCDDCDAYQEVRARDGHPNVHRIRVFHDEWCPTLARKQGRTP